MPTVRLAAAETGVSHRANLRLRHLCRPAPNRRVGIEPVAWRTGSSAHESKVPYFCIGANGLTDITELKIPAAQRVNTMLGAAIERVTETGARPVVHSYRGGHYRWPG
jgi:hypothetical protein